MERPQLGSEIKRRLDANRIGWAEAAERLELKANSLRAWVTRNEFPQWALPQILELVGFPTDVEVLQNEYEFRLTRGKRASRDSIDSLLESEDVILPDAFSVVDMRLEKMFAAAGDPGLDHKVLFRSLAKGDTRVLWSIDQEPWELSHEGLRTLGLDMVNAARAGARFLYLCPANEVSSVARRSDFRRPLEIEDFRGMLSRIDRLIESQCKRSEIKATRERFILAECKVPAYMMPGFSIALYCAHVGDAYMPLYRALALIPAGKPERDMTLHVPLDRIATDRFLGFVKAALHESGDSRLAEEL
jgi:hypothetical protein